MADQPANRAVLAYAIGIADEVRDRWEDALEHLRLAVECPGDGSADPLTFSRAARELDRIDTEPYFQFDVGVDVENLRERALHALEPAVDTGGPAVAKELFEWALPSLEQDHLVRLLPGLEMVGQGPALHMQRGKCFREGNTRRGAGPEPRRAGAARRMAVVA